MSNKLLLNATNADIINEINKLKNSGIGGSAGNVVLYTPQELTEEQKNQALKNIGLIKNQKPLKNGDVAPSTIYFDTSKDLEQWFTSLSYTEDGGGWDSYYIYGDWSSNVRFNVAQYDITQTDDNGTQILVGHYYTLSYQKKDSNQEVFIYVSNDAIDSFFKVHEELMGLKLVKGWNTNILDTSAIAGEALNLPDNTDFMYSESLAGSQELYLKNGVQALTEAEQEQVLTNLGLIKKESFKLIQVNDSVDGSIDLDTSLNLDEVLAGLTYDSQETAPLYSATIDLSFGGTNQVQTMPILLAGRMTLGDGTYFYVIMDAIAAMEGQFEGGILYASQNTPSEELAQLGVTKAGWIMEEYNPVPRLELIGATVNSCVVTSVPEVGFAGIDSDFVETYLTKKSQSLTEAEKLQVQANIGLISKGKPLANGDIIPNTIYFDTSRDIDALFATLDFSSSPMSFIFMNADETCGMLVVGQPISEGSTEMMYIFGALVNGAEQFIYVSHNMSSDILEQAGFSATGWQMDSVDMSGMNGAELTTLPEGWDFMSAEPYEKEKFLYLKNGVQELTDAEKKQILMNLGLANLPLQIDSNLSSTSTNPVQNRAIYNYFSNYGSLNSSNNWLGNNTFKSIPYATNGYGVHNGTDEFNNTFYKHGKIEIAGDNPRTLTLPEKSGILATLDDIQSGSGGTSFSGSYNDLTDKPDLGKFALSSMVETNINAIRTLTQPSFLKYISFNDTNEVIIALSQENKAVMSEWIAAGNFVRPIYLWDVANKTYYPMTMATVSGVQYEIYFQKGSTLYIGIYDSENDSYGFSE